MAISDLFSSAFLFSIAIIIILIGGIFAYVSYRLSEQEHKLSSMVSLVSILAQELHLVKSKVHSLQNESSDSTNILQYPSQIIGGENQNELISVSDGEDTEYEEDTDEEDEDDGFDEEVEDETDDEYDTDNPQEQLKLLNLTLANDNIENDSPIEDLNNDFEELIQNNDIKTIYLENPIDFQETEAHVVLNEDHMAPEEANVVFEELIQNNDIKTIHLEQPIDFEIHVVSNEDNMETEEGKITNEDISFLKNVSITDSGDLEDINTSKSEYKKMSLNKLREVALSKGVVSDASKLKKHDILKLLGDE